MADQIEPIRGIVLYIGNQKVSFDPDLMALPLDALSRVRKA